MYEHLLSELKKFLMNYYISISYTDIFEESLLKMAGIVTQPRKCHFGKIDETKMFFSIKGIREDETLKFLAFFKSFGDSASSYSFNDEKDAHYFEVDTKIVFEKILPIFQSTIVNYAKQSPHSLKHYRLQSIDSSENKAMRLVNSISGIEKYIYSKMQPQQSWFNPISKLYSIFYTETEQNLKQLSITIAFLKASILEHVLEKQSYEKVIESSQSFVKCCSNIKDDEKVKNLQERLNKYCDSIIPHLYYITRKPVDPKYALARKASLLQILSKKQLGLPDEMQALIISFLANHKRGLCKYGPQGTIIYPSNMPKQEHAYLEKYEQSVFKFFKNLSGKSPADKKKEFVEHQFEDKIKPKIN